MDDFTRTLLDLACRECERKRIKLTVANVRRLADKYWIHARDNTIATWAERIVERSTRARLVDLFEVVFDLLTRAGIYHWEWPGDDEEEIAWTVAWGLATLRWINREAAGRTPPRPACTTDDELRMWIEEQKIYRLPLWAGLRPQRALGVSQ